MHLVVMVGEILLFVYQCSYIQKTLTFNNHFCGSFGKLNDRATSMFLFYMHF